MDSDNRVQVRATSSAMPQRDKALFAAQQLRESARLWWDHFTTMLPKNHIVTWQEFRTAFRAHHVPEGLIERKLNEFLALTQGTRTVTQYALSRKVHCHCLSVESYSETLCDEMRKLNLEMIPQGTLNHISVEPTLHDQIIMAQLHDKGVGIIKQKVLEGERKYKCFCVDHKGILWFESHLVVPKNQKL